MNYTATSLGGDAATAQRAALEAQLRLLSDYGAGYSGAQRGSNPGLDLAQGGVDAALNRQGPSPIRQELQGQALSELRLGGRLTEEQSYLAAQGARQASNARGLVGSNRAQFQEVLERSNLSDQRRNERRAFADGVDQVGYSQAAGDRAFSLGAAGQASDIYDPTRRVAYGDFLSASTAGAQITSREDIARLQDETARYLAEQDINATAARQQAGFDYDREDTTRNAGYASDIADRNNSAATSGAAIGATGAIVGGVLIAF